MRSVNDPLSHLQARGLGVRAGFLRLGGEGHPREVA
jgi:hypothetical protein